MNNLKFQRARDRHASIARVGCGHYPTPIEELPRLRKALGASAPRILIKRDDYTGAGFGGNKVRKLEYLLARARTDGAEVVITSGGLRSNHARVTAALCARLGLRCILVLNPAAMVPEGLSPANLTLDRLYGAELIRVADRQERASTMEAVAARLRSEGLKVEIIPLGGSVPLGALGFVRAVAEAKAQLEAAGDKIDYLFHATSSGGTQAGILAGLQLFEWRDVADVGVSPDDPAESIAAEVRRIVQGVGELLGVGLDAEPVVLDQYVGQGYGVPSKEGEEALQLLARTEGIVLDQVYTAKAMAGLLDWIRSGKLKADDTVLFWHTGGQLGLFYSALI
jgi:D-cysteine desulfhydrase family pyridoxal phosphate-dependent enzyme